MAIQKPSNWENVKAMAERVSLPVNAYVCKIVGAKVADYTDKTSGALLFQRLEIAFDIAEGEYTGHFQNDFDAQTGEDKKWKGVLRQYLPKDNGDEKDEYTKSALKALIECLEECNPGFHFDWDDERKLKGKMVGVLFRNEQWAMGERSGWKAQPFKALSLERVRSGKFTLPKEKPNKNAVNIDILAEGESFAVIDDTEDLPF